MAATMDREAPLQAIDARELRQVLSTFVTGVTVVTTVDREGRRHGVTANSFTSVSLEPPLVLWSQALKAFSHPAFRDAGRFAVNILADDQIALSNRFARAGEDKFGGTPVREGLGGVPLIEGCAAYVECRHHVAHEAGDHMIFVGHVERMARTGRRPLAFGGGRYLIAQPHDFGRLTADEANANRARLQAVRLATHAAVELAARVDETIGVAVWGTHGPTVLHWEPSSRPVSMSLRAGAVLPLLRSATGRVFAAPAAARRGSGTVRGR
ncbi:MAG: flavin reductase [Rubrivivax sp.]